MTNILIRDTEIKITDVLKLLGEGYTYKQISEKLNITPNDIILSVHIASDIISDMVSIRGKDIISAKMEVILKNNRLVPLEEVRKKHPRAFEKWHESETNNLISYYKSGKSIAEISIILQRTYGSIKAQLEKVGLINR